MFYTPKYCCNCGEKIERAVWNFKASRRFCQLCETEFVSQEWIPRIIVFFGIIGLIVGFAGYFQKPEKPVKISASVISDNKSTPKAEFPSQPPGVATNAKANVQALTESAANSAGQKQIQSLRSPASLQNAQVKLPENQSNSDERVYFCGAATKKGTACSRRVKGGGRCWQHAGQSAILPSEKLIASR